MATSLLNKSTRSPVVANDDDDDKAQQQRAKLPPSEVPDAQPMNGFVPVDIPTPAPTPVSTDAPTGSGQPDDYQYAGRGTTPVAAPTDQPQTANGKQAPMQVPALNQPSPVGDLAQYLGTPIAQLPAFKAAMDARNKLVALDAMPTYTDKNGKVVTGMQDTNGRLQSGLKGLVGGLAHEFDPAAGPVRSWGDLASRATYSISRGVAGAAVPEFDEWADRQRQKAILEQQAQDAEKALTVQEHALSADALNRYRSANTEIKQGSFEERKNQNAIKNLRADKKELLDPIMKRGWYYAGTDPDEDQKLADAGITLKNFDKRHPDITDGDGSRKTFDADQQAYVPTQGTTIDPDKKPIDLDIDGHHITTTLKTWLPYQGQVDASRVAADQKTEEAAYKDAGDRAELAGRIEKAQSDVEKAQQRLTEIGGMTGMDKIQAAPEVEKLNKEIRESQSDLAGWQARLKAMPAAPKFQGRTPAKVVSTKYAGQSFHIGDVRNFFPGKSDDDIRSLIKSNGGTVLD